MKSNETLQKDVQEAIKWEPLLHVAEIGVIAKDGIITLTGTVDSYVKKLEAEEAAKSVAGVKAVIEKIKVQFDSLLNKDDNEIAHNVLNAFNWNWEVPKDKIKITVENGWVRLEGELQWNYQKEAAKKSVHNLVGVKGISNDIIIKSEANDKIEKGNIESALARHWSLNSDDIQVEVSNNKVTLSGIVDSWYERTEAERIAWNAPGVWEVENELVLEFED
jgi:osmotically-inducible protein OsmY